MKRRWRGDENISLVYVGAVVPMISVIMSPSPVGPTECLPSPSSARFLVSTVSSSSGALIYTTVKPSNTMANLSCQFDSCTLAVHQGFGSVSCTMANTSTMRASVHGNAAEQLPPTDETVSQSALWRMRSPQQPSELWSKIKRLVGTHRPRMLYHHWRSMTVF